eukprot:TRINITY_DN5893_c1_g1_i1.p1 TRINITY_DN5893_c1_g1~~TRINITY_DN5893_c1_g1_i1.p1  ORF type:complete len:373 (+),score=66.51 TRINITY_DN5893_c1_g1_i1:89-1207(+)
MEHIINDYWMHVLVAMLVGAVGVWFLLTAKRQQPKTTSKAKSKPKREKPKKQTADLSLGDTQANGGAVKRGNMKGKPLGSIRGQAPDKVGAEGSYKKLKERKAKEEARETRRSVRAERNASNSDKAARRINELWPKLLQSLSNYENNTEDEMKLKMFYNSAVRAEVTASHLNGVELPYAVDKYASRADEACCALLSAYNSLGDRFPVKDTYQVASIGGGPGNDAVGFGVFAEFLPTKPSIVANVYDFAPGFEDIVKKVAPVVASNVNMEIIFKPCDLQQLITDAVNHDLGCDVAGTDVFLFCYSLHESRALSHSLFQSVLEQATTGSVVIVIEVFSQVVVDALKMGESYNFEGSSIPKSADTAFNGGFMIKK